MNAPYFITNDLEVTSGLQEKNLEALNEVRALTHFALMRALGKSAHIHTVKYDDAVCFFEEKKKDDNFVITADAGIYVKLPHISFESTRMYPNEDAILNDKNSYSILTRSGKPLATQKLEIPENIRSIGIYDDGIYSGDTLSAIVKEVNGRGANMNVNVLLNFSSLGEYRGIPIRSYYNGPCTDWVDERDFYYGVMNSGASINPNGVISGVPYISSPRMATEKASIPKETSKEFCIAVIRANKRLWEIIGEKKRLSDVPRLAYLTQKYNPEMLMQDVLACEEKRIQSL